MECLLCLDRGMRSCETRCWASASGDPLCWGLMWGVSHPKAASVFRGGASGAASRKMSSPCRRWGPCRGCGDPPSKVTCFVQPDFAGASANPHQRRICSVSCSSTASSWPSARSTGTAPRPEDASQTPWASRSSSGRMRRDEVGMSRASAASSTCSTVMERRMPVAPVGVVHSRPSFSTSSPEVGPSSRKPSLEVKMTSSAPVSYTHLTLPTKRIV